MAEGVFTLDLNEPFPRLSRAPIVEAVIHWQAHERKSQCNWNCSRKRSLKGCRSTRN